MAENGETWVDVVASTFAAGSDLTLFDSGYGLPEGEPFTLWTSRRVYFPVQYDGSEFAGSAPRNPCAEKTRHVGG